MKTFMFDFACSLDVIILKETDNLSKTDKNQTGLPLLFLLALNKRTNNLFQCL